MARIRNEKPLTEEQRLRKNEYNKRRYRRKKAEISAYGKEYRKKNAERLRMVSAAWREANRVATRAKNRKEYATSERRRLQAKENARRWQAANPERANECRNAWRKRNAERVAAAGRDWEKRNPHKYAAHKKLRYAVRKGEVSKKPCEVCGTKKNIYAPHDDYSRPLDVRWLCRKHHMAADRVGGTRKSRYARKGASL